MKDRRCTFSSLQEVEGNKKEVSMDGTIRSEMYMKKTKSGEYACLLVEGDDGKLYEVFPNQIKLL